MNENDLVIVGAIGSPYGIKGWVRISSFTEPRINISSYRPWVIGGANSWRYCDPVTLKQHGPGFIASFVEIRDRNQARQITGMQIAVDRSLLPEVGENEYYWRDLCGLEVFDQNKVCLGALERMIDIGPHAIMTINDDKEEILIPFVAKHVLNVDFDRRRINVVWHPPI